MKTSIIFGKRPSLTTASLQALLNAQKYLLRSILRAAGIPLVWITLLLFLITRIHVAHPF